MGSVETIATSNGRFWCTSDYLSTCLRRESHTQDHDAEKITSKGIKILSCVGVLCFSDYDPTLNSSRNENSNEYQIITTAWRSPGPVGLKQISIYSMKTEKCFRDCSDLTDDQI